MCRLPIRLENWISGAEDVSGAEHISHRGTDSGEVGNYKLRAEMSRVETQMMVN